MDLLFSIFHLVVFFLVVEGLASSTDSSKIVGEGCLSPVLELLAQCKDKTGENWQVLIHAISQGRGQR